jgi:hypothetical protein
MQVMLSNVVAYMENKAVIWQHSQVFSLSETANKPPDLRNWKLVRISVFKRNDKLYIKRRQHMKTCLWTVDGRYTERSCECP